MRDEHFEMFVEQFGEATTKQPIPSASIEAWRTKVPAALLEYWKDEGWSGYANGLFWIVNPEDYEDIVDEWLDGTPLKKADRFYVIARTAFGKLYLWGEKSGGSVKIVPYDNAIYCLPRDLARTLKNPNLAMRAVFSGRERLEADTKGVDKQPLFEQALAKLGPLGPDDMYGFEPALVAGGTADIKHLRIANIKDHLGMLRQLAAPIFPLGSLDIEKLLDK